MQRRSTALWAAFFIVLSVGAYSVIGVAEEPALVDDPDHEFADGSSVEFEGEEYTYDAENTALVYFNESARESETLEADSDVDYRSATYTVLIPNESDSSSFTLLRALPDDVETVTVNETDYVVVERDGERNLVEPDQFRQNRFGQEASYQFSEGDQIDYENQTADVTSVSQDEVELAWDAPGNESITVEEGDRLTFGGTEYVAHLPGDGSLMLTSDVQSYERQVEVRETYQERTGGLWSIVVLGSLAALVLLGLAYMPSRY